MIRIFCGFSSRAIFWTTREDMGKAEIPAAPTMGLIFSFKNRFISFAKRTPPTVSNTKANKPIVMISRVSTLTKLSACMLKEIVMPRRSVIRLVRETCAVSDRLVRTPHSLIRLPNIKKPTRDTEEGAMNPTMKVTTIGKAIRMLFGTSAGL